MNGITRRLALVALLSLIALPAPALRAADDDTPPSRSRLSAPPPAAPAPQRAAELAPPVLLIDADHPVAAPFVADIDADGRLDLLVGEFRTNPFTESAFHLYRRIDGAGNPRFDAGAFLTADGKPATVPAFCYTGSAPQIVDFDGDGKPDLVSPAMIGRQNSAVLRIFPGRGVGRFDKSFDITFIAERDVKSPVRYTCYNIRTFVYDWDGDGDMDILAAMSPRIWLARNVGDRNTPRYAPVEPLTIDNEHLRASAASLVVADWDGDGRPDLLVGENDGGVRWFRNTAPQGEPTLAAGEVLVPPTALETSHTYPKDASYTRPAQPAFAARICVADITGDGRPDLILGDRVYAVAQGPEETPAQTESRQSAQLRVNAARDALNRLESADPPTTEESRAARETQIEAARAEGIAAWNALQNLLPNRYERHGSVWLYQRLTK